MIAPVQAVLPSTEKAPASGCQAADAPRAQSARGLGYAEVYRAFQLPAPISAETFAPRLASIFESVAAENEGKAFESAFAAKKVPSISLADYFVRVAKYSRCSFETLTLAVVYVDRYNEAKPDHLIAPTNAHK